MIKKIKEKFKEAFNADNIGITICFILFLGPLAYVYFKTISLGELIWTIIIGYCCYIWGYIRGIDVGKEKHLEETSELDE